MQKPQNSPNIILRTGLAFLIVILILGLSGTIGMTTGELVSAGQAKELTSAFFVLASMLFLSLLIAVWLTKGKIGRFGFCWKSDHVMQAVVIGLIGGVIASIMGTALPGEEHGLLKDAAFWQVILLTWIWAAICEEALTRGVVIGYLAPFQGKGFKAFGMWISYPIIISAVFFSLMHINPVIMEMGLPRMFNIVFFAFVLSILAGYYREKTGSLLPAVLIHSMFNAGGTLVGYILPW
ncbi:CPBP family intramembrane metalloprotease [bacterium]|nr:CPBP family intramembrane metalloprotease [bacterium]MBU1651484.1 CPBP family intramembrane metalloprotease [bacterium]MBU1881368.1 CPBP family intramembrane metalloprotease [bacterium]